MATSLQIAKLTERHRQIMDLDLRGLGPGEIARQLGVSPNHVSIVTNSGPYQHEISIRRAQLDAMNAQRIVDSNDEVAAAIREKTLAAAKRLGLVVDSGKDSDAIRAAEALLDRGGYPRVTKTEDKSVRITIDAADLSRLTETLEMLGDGPAGQDQQGGVASAAHDDGVVEDSNGDAIAEGGKAATEGYTDPS